MRLLADEDVWGPTISLLRARGHDLLMVSELVPRPRSDRAVLESASRSRRILVTRDRDFGALVFVIRLAAGVVYLRFLPDCIEEGHAQLARVLAERSEEELLSAFVVVEPARYRFRRLG